MTDDPTQRTRLLAYQLWEAGGRPMGRMLEFWLEAEQTMQAIAASPAVPGPQAARTPAEHVKHKDPALHAASTHDRELDEGLQETFPASDPLASTQRGPGQED